MWPLLSLLGLDFACEETGESETGGIFSAGNCRSAILFYHYIMGSGGKRAESARFNGLSY